MKLWDLETGAAIRSFETGTRTPQYIAITKDLKVVSLEIGIGDIALKIWDRKSNQVSRIDMDSYVWTAAIAPDGRGMLCFHDDKTLRLWDLTTGSVVRKIKTDQRENACLAFAPDGRTAVSSGLDNVLRTWDLAGEGTNRTFAGHNDAVLSVAVNSSGRSVVSGSSDKTIKLWDLATGKLITTFGGNVNGVTRVVIAPDGHTVLSGFDTGYMKLWALENS